MAASKACEAIFWPIPGLTEEYPITAGSQQKSVSFFQRRNENERRKERGRRVWEGRNKERKKETVSLLDFNVPPTGQGQERQKGRQEERKKMAF